jgi:hypothetical protein
VSIEIFKDNFQLNHFFFFRSVIEMNNDVVTYTYFTPYTRVISFFSGILLAHILEQEGKTSNEKVSDSS